MALKAMPYFSSSWITMKKQRRGQTRTLSSSDAQRRGSYKKKKGKAIVPGSRRSTKRGRRSKRSKGKY